MLNSFSDWLCNVMLWGGIVTLAVLLYETFAARGFLANDANVVTAVIAVALVGAASLFWPRY